jgi:hypothetical protein
MPHDNNKAVTPRFVNNVLLSSDINVVSANLAQARCT